MNKTEKTEKLMKVAAALRALGEDFADDADCLEAYALSAAERRFTIVNAGTTNTGKSTLFNALLGREEAFRTADVRETTVCRDIGWGRDAVLTDTPGCGSCSEADDREAAKAYRRADLVMFVHNLATGGLTQSEMDVLASVRRALGEEDFRTRTIVVGTRLDSCGDGSEAVNRRECEDQIEAAFGVKLPFFAVSSRRHLRGLGEAAAGRSEAAAVFLKAGGIEPLARHLASERGRQGRRGLARFRTTVEKIRRLTEEASARLARSNERLDDILRSSQASRESLEAEIRRLKAA